MNKLIDLLDVTKLWGIYAIEMPEVGERKYEEEKVFKK